MVVQALISGTPMEQMGGQWSLAAYNMSSFMSVFSFYIICSVWILVYRSRVFFASKGFIQKLIVHVLRLLCLYISRFPFYQKESFVSKGK